MLPRGKYKWLYYIPQKTYSKAEVTVSFAEEAVSQISIKKPDLDSTGPLDPSLSHAIFLSGKSDQAGDLMNKLALINLETMKLAKKKFRLDDGSKKDTTGTSELLKADISNTVFESLCPKPNPCDSTSKYR